MNFLKTKVSAIKTFCRWLLWAIQGGKMVTVKQIYFIWQFLYIFTIFICRLFDMHAVVMVVAQCALHAACHQNYNALRPLLLLSSIFCFDQIIWSVLIIININWNHPKTGQHSCLLLFCIKKVELNLIRHIFKLVFM